MTAPSLFTPDDLTEALQQLERVDAILEQHGGNSLLRARSYVKAASRAVKRSVAVLESYGGSGLER